MRIVSTPALLAAALALAATGCAPTESRPAAPAAVAEATPRDREAFLWLRNTDGFNTIDDEHIVLHAGTKHALVKTFGFCFGLRDAETIAVDAPLGYLDKSGLGHIVYNRFPGDKGRCPIDRIVAVGSLKEAKELVAKEKAEKAAKAEEKGKEAP